MKEFFQKIFNYLTYRIWRTDEELLEETNTELEISRIQFLTALRDSYQKELDSIDKRTKKAKELKAHIEDLTLKLNE
jgi:hypothetical protein